MATSISGSTSEIAVLRQQAHITDMVVHMDVKDISQEDSLVQPRPAGNCLNWVLGHLVCIYNEMLPMLGQQPVKDKGAFQRYARGSAPLTDPAEALHLRDLIAAWEESTKRVDAGLASLTPETLDAPAPASPTDNPDETIRTLLGVIAFHQAYHAGQLGVLRRIAGKSGAIA